MAATPKAYRTNIIRDSSVVLSSLDEQAAFPSAWARDQLRSKKERSAVGWNHGALFNDEICFTTADATRRGFVAPGNYATGAAEATAITTAMANAGVDIKSMAACTGYYRADAVTIDGSGNVQTASDLTGNGRDFTQSTSNLRPLWVPNAWNSRPGIYWNGTVSQGLSSAAALSAFLGANGVGAGWALIALDSDAAANDPIIWVINGADTMLLQWTGTTVFQAQLTDSASASKAANKTAASGLSVLQLVMWWYDQANVKCFAGDWDDAAAASTASTNAVKSTVLSSVVNVGSTSANATKGYILEWGFLNAAPNEATRRQMVDGYRSKYSSLTDATTAATWNVVLTTTYDATTKKFTIARTSGAGNPSLLCNSSTPASDNANQCYADLGFDTSSDKTGATTYTATNASYQSRHWIKAYLPNNGSTQYTLTALLDDNVSGTGTVTLKNNSIDLWRGSSGGLAGTAVNSSSPDGAVLFATFSGTANSYWRWEINDVQNSAGYNEIGVLTLGSVDVAPTNAYDSGYVPNYDDFSVPQYGPSGALHLDERPQRSTWRLVWSLMSTADYNAVVAFRKVTTIGRAFYLALDSTGSPTDLRYVELAAPIQINHVARSKDLWHVEMIVREALG